LAPWASFTPVTTATLQAIDEVGADLVLHGHMHNGTERGATPKGTPVRNVAQPVIRRAYNVYLL
jgi:predicted MPP superfamily phosphohydrolase